MIASIRRYRLLWLLAALVAVPGAARAAAAFRPAAGAPARTRGRTAAGAGSNYQFWAGMRVHFWTAIVVAGWVSLLTHPANKSRIGRPVPSFVT
jgi:hypothetical protein